MSSGAQRSNPDELNATGSDPSGASGNPGMMTTVLRNLSSLFELTDVRQKREHWELWLLAAIVLAGAVVRFWGLGDVGLRGDDEDTMALPVMHLVEHGSPTFPSGMFYARAIAHTYLMAGSVLLFGESEWSFRLPSAVCGVLLIVLAYFFGRRFLTPGWNLAFVGSVAFHPDLIVLSQTARMYIFLLASIATYSVLIFAWERTGRTAWLIGAVLMMAIGLQFQVLMIFTAVLLFFPGLLHGSWRKLLLGGVAFAATWAIYISIDNWVNRYFLEFTTLDVPLLPQDKTGTGAEQQQWILPVPAMAAGALAAAVVAWLAATRVVGQVQRAIVTLVLFLGLYAQLSLNYHVGILLLIAGAVIALRKTEGNWKALVPPLVWFATIAVAQILWLKLAEAGSRGIIIDILMGRPAIWPFVNFAAYSYAAVALTMAGAVTVLWMLIRNVKVPDYWLFFVLAVWFPLLFIADVRPGAAQRYMIGSLVPLLAIAFATAHWLMVRSRAIAGSRVSVLAQRVVPILVCLAVVNPMAVARSIDSGYELHPDHKGAAEYMKSLHLAPEDILIAEDVLTQTYYLDHVDYWLQRAEVAAKAVWYHEGAWRDRYTNAPAIMTAEALESVLEQPLRGDIYVIGSGEGGSQGSLYRLGAGIQEILSSGEFEVVYRGRDGGQTMIWKLRRAVSSNRARD